MLEITMAESSIGSPRPSCVSRGDRNMAEPPSWAMPASKDTRVRVDDFSKIIARTLFLRESLTLPARQSRRSREAWSSRSSSSLVDMSFSVRKCLTAMEGPFRKLRNGLVLKRASSLALRNRYDNAARQGLLRINRSRLVCAPAGVYNSQPEPECGAPYFQSEVYVHGHQ